MNFAASQPSTAWEGFSFPNTPNASFWAWFKPSQAPHDVIFQIPEETYRTLGTAITLRRLLAISGVDPQEAHSWTVRGMTYPVQGGANPLLDQPLPQPGTAGVAVHMLMLTAMPPGIAPPRDAMSPPGPHGAATGVGTATAGGPAILEALDAEWQAIVQHERQLEALRRQLGSIQGTLQSYNRDLDPDERRYSDSQSKKDWQDARRWLRDGLALISKAVRAYDIGVTSAAGSRNRFEQIYRDFIEPRRPFPGMDTEQLAFEQYRKNHQNLIHQMQSAHAFAARDGVQRAQSVLNRIAVKVRNARAKR